MSDTRPPASVLLVDDNESSLVALTALLEPLGQRLVTAKSGEEALKRMLYDDFAVVLMDVKLPGIDGYETANLMRGISRTRMVPVIFVTGVYREPSQVLRGYGQGAVDYLFKPYDAEIVRSKVSVFVELYEMRAELERARVAEKEQHRRLFEAVLTQMPAGIVVIEAPSGAALLSNTRLARVLGTSDVKPFIDHPAYPMSRCLVSGELIEDETVLYRRGADELRLALSAAPVADEAGHVVAVVGTIVDVTAREAAEREREQLIAALEASNTALETFAYVASHDLKAPMRAISSLTTWIEESLAGAQPAVRENLTLLRARVNRMMGLIDGILKFARAGSTDSNVGEVSLSELIRDTIDLLQPPMTVEIEFEVDPAVEVLTTARAPLQQILLNLVGNALKHSTRPDTRIVISARSDESGATHFSVDDNGPGIPAEAQARIWEIFQTLEPHRQENTGIGLAVVRRTLEARGGKAWVESEVGRGATFHWLWPLA